MRDGIRLADRGIPSVGYITAAFTLEARFVARAGGIPDIPCVILPHPTAGIGEPALRRLAAEVSGLTVPLLRGRPA